MHRGKTSFTHLMGENAKHFWVIFHKKFSGMETAYSVTVLQGAAVNLLLVASL